MTPKLTVLECTIHRKTSRLSSVVQKFSKLQPKSIRDKCGFLQNVALDGIVMSELWEEDITVLKLMDPRCPLCLEEARELSEFISNEMAKINLVAIVESAPHLKAYLTGGLYNWTIVNDADAKISGILNLTHPKAHSTYVVAPGGIILASYHRSRTPLTTIFDTLTSISNL